jgi:hypothetical protein
MSVGEGKKSRDGEGTHEINSTTRRYEPQLVFVHLDHCRLALGMQRRDELGETRDGGLRRPYRKRQNQKFVVP